MKKIIRNIGILVILLFVKASLVYSQQIYTPSFHIEASNITPNCNTANFTVEHSEVCNDEFVCAGVVAVENTDFVQTFLPYQYGVSPQHLSFTISYDGGGYPRFLLLLSSVIYKVVDFQPKTEGHYIVALDEALANGYESYLASTHQIQFLFFVVDEEHKNTIVTSPAQLFVPDQQICVPMNGTFSFSLEATYEQTGYFPDLSPIDPGPVSSDQSYVRTRIITTETGDSHIDEYTYYDGLGRPMQTIQRGITPLGNDLAVLQQYDVFGRKSRSWLPVPISENNGAYVPLVRIMSEARDMYDDRKAYSYPIYDSSPLDRVMVQYGPGEKWQVTGHAQKVQYLTNDETDSLKCLRFTVSDYGPTDTVVVVTGAGRYSPWELYVRRMEDEDRNVVFEFRNKRNQIVLTRQVLQTDADREFMDTYYLYNSAGMLRAVLPPMASISMQGEGTWSSDTSNILRQYAYLYRYDMRNRCISKRLPGSDWIRIVYDRTDAPIFTQNGAQRLRGEWAFAIPDIFGRTALSGICSNVLNAGSLAAVSVRAVPTNDEAEAFAGYDISGTILSSPHHVSAYYYDDYDFLALSEFSNKDLEYDDSGVDASFLTRYGSDAEGYKHTGLQTGSRMAIVSADPDMDSCLYVATYYDKKKRPIQSRNYGHHGKDHEYLVYTFTGQPSVSKHVYPGDWIVTTENDYDHAERLRETTIEVDGPSGSHAGTRIGYAYDELGRLASKTYGTGDSPLQIHYTHNMHGELVQQQSDRFCMSLAYESPLYVAPSYSGNIVEWTWQYGDGDENTYAFSYDNLSRLTNTKQYLDGTCVDRFVEQGIAYDRNGNMLSLDRSRGDGTGSDFSYMYEGNRLVSLVDSGENYSYTYDTNGNLIHDGANNLDITYNDLNQIEKVNRDGAVLANYSYLADGTKFSATDADGNGLYYLGSLVYERSSSGQSLELESLGFDGGRFIKTTSGLEPRYFITDHLGSVRVVVNDQGEVLEQNDYYPFGLRWENAESPITDNRYRYNGKEEQSFVSVPYIDYGARMYDPKYGIRWTGVDPLAEKYYSCSPYAFCMNNPILLIDINGESPYYDKQGRLIRVDEFGFTGDIYIMVDGSTEPLQKVSGLTLEAQSNILTDVMQHMRDTDFSKLHNGKVSITTNRMINGKRVTYNDPYEFTSRYSTLINEHGDIIITTIEGSYQIDLYNVETIQNYLGVHEYIGHGLKGYSGDNKNHWKAYDDQIKHPTFNKMPKDLQREVMDRRKEYLYHENYSLYQKIYGKE